MSNLDTEVDVEAGCRTDSGSGTVSTCGEKDQGRAAVFRFLDLPGEIRNRIYELYLVRQSVIIDLDPNNYRLLAPRLALLQTCRQVHFEASRIFYGHHTFRLFPLHGRFFHSRRPLLARLGRQYRAAITSIDLHLGPGWSNPPKSWRIERTLGLEDATSVRRLTVFVECDPSHPIFTGFRVAESFYTSFCGQLLQSILSRLPSVQEVCFDAFPSVAQDGALMSRLRSEAKSAQKIVSWGPLRQWSGA